MRYVETVDRIGRRMIPVVEEKIEEKPVETIVEEKPVAKTPRKTGTRKKKVTGGVADESSR